MRNFLPPLIAGAVLATSAVADEPMRLEPRAPDAVICWSSPTAFEDALGLILQSGEIVDGRIEYRPDTAVVPIIGGEVAAELFRLEPSGRVCWTGRLVRTGGL